MFKAIKMDLRAFWRVVAIVAVYRFAILTGGLVWLRRSFVICDIQQ